MMEPPYPSAPTTNPTTTTTTNITPPNYDETTGTPLPSDGVYRYTSVYGHVVLPISEAYEKRRHRLQVDYDYYYG